jgi:6-hydroxytryprostatin B O-methyltransferase
MSTLPPSITDLAETIKSNTKIVAEHLQNNSLPPLSLSADTYPFFPGTGPGAVDHFPSPSQEIIKARNDARQAYETLLQLLDTPADNLFYYMCQHFNSACLQYVYHFHIAVAVPLDDEVSFAEIAKKAGVNELQCTRILRTMITHNYFHESRPGYIRHTAGSKLLLNSNVKDSVGYLMEEGFLGAPKISAAFEKFGNSQERSHTPWNLAHGSDLPIFEFFETERARMTRFLGNMDNFGSQEGYNIKHLVNGYDWKDLGRGTVVDVGGSTGHCSFAIAEVAPELKFVVQDLEKVIDGVKKRINQTARIDFQVHDFFEVQPIKDAEVYLLRFICHDYSDKYAAKILGNIVPAMGSNSRMVLMDGIMPAPNVITKREERRAR